MVVSSNTLFQFTSSLDTVKKILESKGFWPRYCIEYGWNKLIAVPQCCFCDIPLSAIQSHMKTYGEYGFGMSKEWGISHGLAPIAYLIKDSLFVKTIRKVFRKVDKKKNEKENERRFLAFIKLYKGVNYRPNPDDGKEEQHREYLYYNEREWRYVPTEISPDEIVKIVHDKKEFNCNKESEKTRELLCKFDVLDVRYIIVKNDDDRMELVKFIYNLKGWDDISKSNLCSKIITNQLIKEDI